MNRKDDFLYITIAITKYREFPLKQFFKLLNKFSTSKHLFDTNVLSYYCIKFQTIEFKKLMRIIRDYANGVQPIDDPEKEKEIVKKYKSKLT